MIKNSRRLQSVRYAAVLLALCTIAFTAVSAETADLPEWPHEKSDLKPDPTVKYGRLPNGVRFILMPNNNPEDRVSMHLDVIAGSLNEKPDQRGLAHFLEHMMFSGTTHFPPGEMVKYFQSLGMQFGPDVNAHTGFSETVYDLLLPDGRPQSLKEGLTVLLDYAAGALLLPEEIERERGVILAEKRTRDSVSYRTFKAIMNFEFSGTRIPKRHPIGTTRILKKADRALLKDYYDTWYRPEHFIIVMVGDFDVETAGNLISRIFGSMEARRPASAEPEIAPLRHQGVKPFYHFEKEAGSTEVTVEVMYTVPEADDSLAQRKKKILADLAGQIMRHRLDRMLSSQDAVFTEAVAGSGLFLDKVRYAFISAETDPDRWAATLGVLEQSLREALVFGFQDAEVQRVKREYSTRLNTAVAKADTRESEALARKVIQKVNSNDVFLSPRQKLRLFSDFIEDITAEEIHSSFVRLWNAGHRLILVTGNADLTGKETLPTDKIVSVYQQSAAMKIVEKPAADKVSFPYLQRPEQTGRIVSRNILSNPDVLQVDFENGVRLNIMSTDFKAKEVLVDVAFGPGRAGEPKVKPGLSLLAEAVVNESGLGQLDRSSLDRALAGTNTTVSFNISDEAFHFSGESVTAETALLFQLLYAHFMDPAYRKTAYDLTMKRFAQQYKAFSRSVEGYVQLEVERFLAGGDWRFGWPDWEQMQQIGMDDIRQWIDPMLRSAPLEISIVGDLDVDAVVDIAARYFGGDTDRTAVAELPDVHTPIFPEGQSVKATVDTKIDKGLVIVAYPSDDIWDIRRTRRVSVLADIFSERLRQRIREKLGATYSPFAYNRPSKAYDGYGVFKALVHVAPAQSGIVVDEIKGISKDLSTVEVSEDELKRSIEPLLNGIKDMRQNNRYWVKTVLSGSRKNPSQIAWSRNIIADYAAITTADIFALAKQYLKKDRAATVTILPRRSAYDNNVLRKLAPVKAYR